MKPYHNTMEEIVEAQMDELAPSLGCCLCEKCRGDIIAYALNHLPPRYVMSDAGRVMVQADHILKRQSIADVRTALIQASMVVKEKPRH